ncbi:MAG: hypothetical protein DIZ78_09535 [endosymbiont of Escarpia spicata]|uniref:Uncharacterized protein n=1 Tax=endosymbiont of Escarpia spicata TaxID=2200908 RepID=A0A370DPA5_9GAMM|nr:MAG: hypothetical protein DIZ78_09535 [endosymbiont of Escarpia spicata]
MTALTREELQQHAGRIGIRLDSLQYRIKIMGLDAALNTPRQTKSQAGKKGGARSNWRRFKLPGSPH